MPTASTPKEKPKKRAKKNNYYNEEKVNKLIVEYQKTSLTEIGDDGKMVVLWKDTILEEQIMVEIIKIVKAIIQVYRYYIFEDYDDCLQHGSMSCFQNFQKWTKEKGSSFNFFSIIAKRSLLNYTDRRKKHRNHNDIADQLDLYDNKTLNLEFYLEEVQDTLIDIINKSFIGKKRKRFISISLILVDYLKKTKKFVSKTDFYSWARSYGMRSIDIREFMKAMREHGSELFGDAEDDDY